MKTRWIAGAAALALIAACGSSDPSTPTPDAPINVDGADGSNDQAAPVDAESVPAMAEDEALPKPQIIEIKTDAITAAASIDGAIGAFAPALGARLKNDVEAAFQTAKKIADEEAALGEEFFMPHDYQYEYAKTASVGDLISVEFMEMLFTGGAHPNYIVGGILYDRASGEDIFAPELLTEEGAASMRAHLMDELAKQKLSRMSMTEEDLPLVRQDVEDVFPQEIDFWFGQVTLIPAVGAETFGGLVVHYSPYEVGSYAEGSYEIMVPASKLADMLAEPYAAMFGGEPNFKEYEEH